MAHFPYHILMMPSALEKATTKTWFCLRQCAPSNRKPFFFHRTWRRKRKLVLSGQRLPSGSLIPEPPCVWFAQVNLRWPGEDITAGPVERSEGTVSIPVVTSMSLGCAQWGISPRSHCSLWNGQTVVVKTTMSSYLCIRVWSKEHGWKLSFLHSPPTVKIFLQP